MAHPSFTDCSHALRGHASREAPRHHCAGVDSGTQGVTVRFELDFSSEQAPFNRLLRSCDLVGEGPDAWLVTFDQLLGQDHALLEIPNAVAVLN